MMCECVWCVKPYRRVHRREDTCDVGAGRAQAAGRSVGGGTTTNQNRKPDQVKTYSKLLFITRYRRGWVAAGFGVAWGRGSALQEQVNRELQEQPSRRPAAAHSA